MVAAKKVSVLLVTADPILHYAVRYLFGVRINDFGLENVINYDTVRLKSDYRNIGLILVDVQSSDHVNYLVHLRENFVGLPILCWCNPAIHDLAKDLQGLCTGVVSRSASGEDLLDALSRVAEKPEQLTTRKPSEIQVHLTYREGQLITLLARGYKNKDIAACLGISTGTVKVYLSTLFKKTGARDRFELNLFGIRNCLFGCAEVSDPVPEAIAFKRAMSRPLLTSMRLLRNNSEARDLAARCR